MYIACNQLLPRPLSGNGLPRMTLVGILSGPAAPVLLDSAHSTDVKLIFRNTMVEVVSGSCHVAMWYLRPCRSQAYHGSALDSYSGT